MPVKSEPTPKFGLQQACEILAALAEKDPTEVTNAHLQLLSSVEAAITAGDTVKPFLDAIAKDKRFAPLIKKISDAGRHEYCHHGRSFEAITATHITAGFIAGVQFALNNFKSSLPQDPSSDVPLSPPLVN